MEFYGSRYTPKRYRCEPVVVSTEYYDYTSTAENDYDSSSTGAAAGVAGVGTPTPPHHYRVMPITYEECPPGYTGGMDDYNIQSYGSNVVLPFTACIEIYNNSKQHGGGVGGKHLHIVQPHPHQHHHVGAAPPAGAKGLTPLNPGGGGGADFSTGPDDEIIINVRQVPVCCACCSRQQQAAAAAATPAYGVAQVPPTPSPIYRMSDRSTRYDTPVQYFRCPMPCCSSMRSPVAAAGAPRGYRRSGTHNLLINDPYSIGDLSSLYRSSYYTSHRRSGGRHHHVPPPPPPPPTIPDFCCSTSSPSLTATMAPRRPRRGVGCSSSSGRPQLIAEFVDIIDQCGPRRLYSKRYCYTPTSSSSKLFAKAAAAVSGSHHRVSPRDSDFYLHDLIKSSKFYSRSPSQEEQDESYYKYETTRERRDSRTGGGERDRSTIYMSRGSRDGGREKHHHHHHRRSSKYFDEHATPIMINSNSNGGGGGGGDVNLIDNSMDKSGTEDSRVYFNKSYDRHQRRMGGGSGGGGDESPRSSKHSLGGSGGGADAQLAASGGVGDKDSRSTRSQRK